MLPISQPVTDDEIKFLSGMAELQSGKFSRIDRDGLFKAKLTEETDDEMTHCGLCYRNENSE